MFRAFRPRRPAAAYRDGSNPSGSGAMGRRIGFGLLAAMLLAGHPLRAQWVVSDPSNLAQGIVNSTKQVVEASRNGSTLLQSFQQTVKIYEQSKKYYDALRSVHNLVKSARRVQQTMLLVGDISDIYISNFRSMLNDTNYSAEGRPAERPEADHHSVRAFDDRQGAAGYYRQDLLRDARIPQSYGILYAQEYLRVVPAQPSARGFGACAGLVRRP